MYLIYVFFYPNHMVKCLMNLIFRNSDMWILLKLACFFRKSHFLTDLFAFGQYFDELHKCRFLPWIASLFSYIYKKKCKLVYPVWIMCKILNNMFFWKNICIRKATARMRLFFGNQTFLLKNYIDLMENSIIFFWNINIAFLNICLRFYSHFCIFEVHCTNRNILPTKDFHNSCVGIMPSVVNLLSNNTQRELKNF